MPQETPSSEAGEAQEASNKASRSPLFRAELNDLQEALGPPQPDLPDDPTQEKLEKIGDKAIEDNMYQGLNEQFRHNEINYLIHQLQRQKNFDDPQKRNTVDLPEFAVVNQARTYHEYFPNALNQVATIMRRYETLRSQTASIPMELAKAEKQAQLYLQQLEQAVSERTAFANVLLMDGKLARHIGDSARQVELREQYLQSDALSAASTNALQGTTAEKWTRGNALNQRIIDLLSGTAKIQGVDDGFLPQRLYLDLLKDRYKQLLEEQKRITKDVDSEDAQERHDELSEKNRKATAKVGPALNPEEADEYQRLRRQLQGRNEELDRLKNQRREITQELIDVTDDLATYQMDMAELSTIQNQFGDQFDFEGVSPPPADTTPENVRRAIAENMETRSNFHLDRMSSFMNTVEEEVLDVGLPEKVEDLWNKDGREAIRIVANALARGLTVIVPERMGLRDAAREALSGPLNEALGWPADKMDVPFNQLTPEEQAEIKKRARSVLDAIKEFDRAKMTSFGETVSLIKNMKPASEYVGQEVRQPPPTERITVENYDQMLEQYGGPTVYVMLFQQLEGDWGSAEDGTGFIGEYATFFGKIDNTIDVHLEVGDALFRLQKTYLDMAKYLALIAALAFGAGAIAALGSYYAGKKLYRRLRPSRETKKLKETQKALSQTRRELSALRQQVEGGGTQPPRVTPETAGASALDDVLSRADDLPKMMEKLDTDVPAFRKILETSKLNPGEMEDAIRYCDDLLKKFPLKEGDAAADLIRSNEFLTGLCNHGDSPLFRLLLRRSSGVAGKKGIDAGLRTFQRLSKTLNITSKGGRFVITTLGVVGTVTEPVVAGLDLYDAIVLTDRIERLEQLGLDPTKDIALTSQEEVRDWKVVSGGVGLAPIAVGTTGSMFGWSFIGTAGGTAIIASPFLLKIQYNISEAEMRKRKTPEEQLYYLAEEINGLSIPDAIVDAEGQTFKQWMDYFHGMVRLDGVTSKGVDMESTIENYQWRQRLMNVLIQRKVMERAPELARMEIKEIGTQKIPYPHIDEIAPVMLHYVRARLLKRYGNRDQAFGFELSEILDDDAKTPEKRFAELDQILNEAVEYAKEVQEYRAFQGLPADSPERRVLAGRKTLLSDLDDSYPKTFGDFEDFDKHGAPYERALQPAKIFGVPNPGRIAKLLNTAAWRDYVNYRRAMRREDQRVVKSVEEFQERLQPEK